jgi:hypothetical protein
MCGAVPSIQVRNCRYLRYAMTGVPVPSRKSSTRFRMDLSIA